MTAALPRIGVELGMRPTKTILAEEPGGGLAVVEIVDARFSDSVPSIAAAVDKLLCVRHPNLVPVRSVRRFEGGVAIASEYVEGETLADLVRSSNGALGLEVRLRVLVDVLAGLAALHDAGLAVGTLTSSSVIVGTDGTTRIAGAWRGPVGARGVHAMERRALAPEIDLGHEPAPPSDVFATGVLLWESLARKTLHDPRGAGAPAVPEDKAWAATLAELAARALSVDPRRRPTVREMAAGIRLVARARLATPPKVAAAVMEFASERVAARRARLARSVAARPSALSLVTPFDADTSPRGRRTLDAEPRVAPSDPQDRSDRPSLAHAGGALLDRILSETGLEPEPATRPRARAAPETVVEVSHVEALAAPHSTGVHDVSRPPRPSLASTGSHPVLERPARRARIAWAAVAAAAVAIVVASLVGRASRSSPEQIATVQPSAAQPKATALASPAAPPAPAPRPTLPGVGSAVGPAPTPDPTPAAGPPPPPPRVWDSRGPRRGAPPLRRPGQYNPSTI